MYKKASSFSEYKSWAEDNAELYEQSAQKGKYICKFIPTTIMKIQWIRFYLGIEQEQD